MKKIGETTRPFRYDQNQIPYDYTVEVKNSFKRLDLIDRVPEELWTEICNIVQEAVIKKIPRKKKYKKDLNDPDNHDGVITHLEPHILECKVKWALENITTNKASGGDGIPVELFQILKDDALKVLHSICQQLWKTQQ